MDLQEFFLKNSPYFFIVYILIKEAFPVINKVVDMVVPSRLAKARSSQDKANELIEREINIEERRLDLTEREVIAKEQSNTLLELIRVDQREARVDHQTMIRLSNDAITALRIILDRYEYRRKGGGPE